MNRTTLAAWTVLLVLSLAGASGCGMFGWFGSDTSQDVQAFDTPAQVLASQAEANYRDGEFEEAAALFQQLKDRYPYSKYALLADLRVGDAYFKAERYEEAVLSYEDFIRLHPKNEAVPYALFQMGMVYYTQMLDPSRDPTFARKASQVFQRLIRNYPGSKEAIRAQPRLQEALERQAAHDMFVGKYYYRTDHYNAAIYRFKRVLTQYPDVGLYGEALEYIKRCQKELAELTPEDIKRRDERLDLERPLPLLEPLPSEGDETVIGPNVGVGMP